MPNKFRKRAPRKRPLGKRQARAVKSIAEKTLKNMSEWKYELTTTSTVITSTPVLHSIHGSIAQGNTDEATRIGDEIYLGSFRLRWGMTMHASGSPSQTVRVVIFQYFNSDTPVAPTILDNDLAAGYLLAPYNTQGQSQGYKILYDKTVTMTQQVASTAPTSKIFNIKVRPGRRKLKYADNSATAARNGIWMILVSNEATNGPTVDLVSRLNYIDP